MIDNFIRKIAYTTVIYFANWGKVNVIINKNLELHEKRGTTFKFNLLDLDKLQNDVTKMIETHTYTDRKTGLTYNLTSEEAVMISDYVASRVHYVRERLNEKGDAISLVVTLCMIAVAVIPNILIMCYAVLYIIAVCYGVIGLLLFALAIYKYDTNHKK
jgi:hypothetical protein